MADEIDHFYMNMALELAQKGRGFTSPNPMVGAVVVKDSQVVGAGFHEKAGGPHAEANALNEAGKKAIGAALYVTLEPCHHTGKTPPCTEKILKSGISRVVAAMYDPNPVAGGGADFLRERGVQVDVGIERNQAERLNEFFVKFIRTNRPFTILKCASTLDGRIATRAGHSKWVTGPASRGFVHKIRHAVDGIMVGVGTVNEDNPSLTTRLENTPGKDPIRIVVDTRLSISENARILTIRSEAGAIVATGPEIDRRKKEKLEGLGVRIIETELRDGKVNLDELMDQLGAFGISSLLIEGGARLAGSALSCGILDKALFFYAPKILGGDDGVPIFRGKGPEKINECIGLHDVVVHRFDDDIMIEGYF
jgi:diaminohydroxyphosphoribosylaminopyrimidine deaminase/5-amino-6-(5-phosphoribosylamino)uracil reductase